MYHHNHHHHHHTQRAFHVAWLSLFMAFFGWHACSSLMPAIQEALELTDKEVWISNIASSSMASMSRFVVGPLCDRYGAPTM